MPKLLIVYFSRTGGAEQMAKAAHEAAQSEEGCETILKFATEAGPEDLLAADGYIFCAPENLAAIAGGMKEFFDRSRPDLVPHGSLVLSASFPSGHSMMAAVAYLTMGVLIARVQPRFHLKVYVMSVAVLLTVLVGVSRVYLGVHWPTDVAAGWLAGGAWAMVCLIFARNLSDGGHSTRHPVGGAPGSTEARLDMLPDE